MHPAGPGEVAALAAAPPPRTVVWLDELQRYLDGEHGLTGGVVRALLGAPGPVVIIGTLWPDRYTAYTAVPAPGGADPHAREREVLDLAAVVRIGAEFSPAEQDRARAAAARDPRLGVALGAAGYGLTQTLAAAPQLVARWEDAQTADPYGWAVLTAALDAARLGARAPLSADLLRAAAPGYCTSAQQAEAPENWFEQALAYATGKLHGAAAALGPAGAGMGQVAGYTVADYLLQHASRERRSARVPASTWDALLSHLRDPADAARLADSARAGCCTATPSRCTVTPPTPATGTPPGGWPSCWPSAATWTSADLRARADAGDGTPPGSWPSCWPSAATWTGCAPGPTPATGRRRRLADLLAERGDLDGLRARADAGDWYAAGQLAELLAERGDLDAAARPGRRRRRVRRRAAGRAAGRARRPGRGRAVLRARADAGDGYAARRLAGLLAERGDLDGLRARADAGDGDAAGGWPGCWPSAGTWTERLRARADAGDGDAAWRLAELLAERGDLDAARPGRRRRRVRRRAAGRAAGRARGPGRAARPGRRRRRVRRPAAGRAAGRARRPGRGVQILRARADAGDRYAAGRLAGLLAERGDLDGLRARADAGDGDAAGRLAGLLAERGDLDGLRARADAGDWHAAGRLAGLLAGRGDLDGLRARADAGDGTPPAAGWAAD